MDEREVVEGAYFPLSREEGRRLREVIQRLEDRLAPSFGLLSERGGEFRLTNLLGTVDLGGGKRINVRPKIASGADWVPAVVSLLSGRERIEVAGERKSGLAKIHRNLLDALAETYLLRLQRAYRLEGPIVLMQQIQTTLSHLHGKLDVTRWSRMAAWTPHIFPVNRIELERDNPFTIALVYVAEALASATTNAGVRIRLRALARDLSVGTATLASLPTNIAGRALPEQWAGYRPAWSLAVAVLTRSSLLGPIGRLSGLGLAVEAWPLLEELLDRTLSDTCKLGAQQGRSLSHRMQGPIQVAKADAGSPQQDLGAKPDGRLFEAGKLIASFEAKYRQFDGVAPDQAEMFQAVTTAMALESPVAVLVYPGDFLPMSWTLGNALKRPHTLLACGLDMFRWRVPGDLFRGKMLLDAVDTAAKKVLP